MCSWQINDDDDAVLLNIIIVVAVNSNVTRPASREQLTIGTWIHCSVHAVASSSISQLVQLLMEIV